MDNGQQTLNSQDSFAASITVGEGSVREAVAAPDDLNTENFGFPHNYDSMGNVALNKLPMPSDKEESVDLIMPPSEEGQVLGEITDVPGAPVSGGEDLEQVEKSSGIHEERAIDEIDPAIAGHFSDGKVNKDDVRYITAEVDRMSDDPVEVANFITEARRTIINGAKGEQK